jgi:hypothetical protein
LSDRALGRKGVVFTSAASIQSFALFEVIVMPAGSMVVFAVGAGPPHVGVWRGGSPTF